MLTFAGVVLSDARGRLLLQRRADFDAWGLPGGVLEIGEDVLTCARRELFEETGLIAGELSLVGVYSEPEYDSVYPNGDQAQQYSICFEGKVSGGELLADGIESRAVEYFKPDEIPLSEVLPWYRAMISDTLGADKPAFSVPTSLPGLTSQIEYMRSYLGSDPFIAAGASAAATREDGSLMVIQHSNSDDWSIPTGYLHLGENASHAAQRVAYEQAGLQVEAQRILGVYSPTELWPDSTGGEVQPVITLFGCRITGGTPDVSSHGRLRADWIRPEKLLDLPTRASLVGLHLALIRHMDNRQLQTSGFD